MASLYEINRQILNLFDEETGEIIDEGAFEALSLARNEKIENIALFIKNLKSDVTAIREEEKALAARRSIIEHKIDSLSDYIAKDLDGEKFSTPRCAITFRKTSSVSIGDSVAVTDYLRAAHPEMLVHHEDTFSKVDIKKLLSDGEDVPTASIEERKSMSIK